MIVLCGPTATGKSGLAIALAKRLHCVILSADSRQVYREFNIGTAKPSIADQQAVPHYLIDICDPTETLTLAEYQQEAQEIIATIHGGKVEGEPSLVIGHSSLAKDKGQRIKDEDLSEIQNRKSKIRNSLPTPLPSLLPSPLLVGGTGLYIRSITRGLKIPRVPPQPELRSQLEALGQPQCYALLQQVDAVSAAKIHPHDQVRTVRSLEVFYTTGHPMSEQQGEHPPSYSILQIGLDCRDTEKLRQRIAHRTQQMITDGFVAEVDYLCQKYSADLPLLNTLGYAEFKQHRAGQLSLAEAKELTILHTRQFAKRQRTWFQADPTIEWFDADAPDLCEQVCLRVEKFLDSLLTPANKH
ncbi:tRNA (adenosine(37)-N6)-dimethylallyltransferase MiaA [Leptodesmis sp.]|uniref:tRNA (adenosine(37)-N6)-dimethylallyltransferase MiaA n=1 Tax=Leptodesmis sp. TaxID=3100501 RepID=UPI0040535755